MIKRFAGNNDGTFGVMIDDNIPFLLTLERQWLENKKGISCIPEGCYLSKRKESPKFGNTFEVTGVPNRDDILIHTGNLDDDSHGCIIVGKGLGNFQDKGMGIVDSKIAFNELMTKLIGIDQFMLAIKSV